MLIISFFETPPFSSRGKRQNFLTLRKSMEVLSKKKAMQNLAFVL